MPFVEATYVYASSQGQRTHSARTKILSVAVTFITISLDICYPRLGMGWLTVTSIVTVMGIYSSTNFVWAYLYRVFIYPAKKQNVPLTHKNFRQTANFIESEPTLH